MTICKVQVDFNKIYRTGEDNVFTCKVFNKGSDSISDVRIRATSKFRAGGLRKYEECSLGQERMTTVSGKSVSAPVRFQEWYSDNPGERDIKVTVEWKHQGIYRSGHVEIPIRILRSNQEKLPSININVKDIQSLATAESVVKLDLNALKGKSEKEILAELHKVEEYWIEFPLKLDDETCSTCFYLSLLDEKGSREEIMAVSTKDSTTFGRLGAVEPDLWIWGNKQSEATGPKGEKHSFIGRRQFRIERVKGGYEIHDVPAASGEPRNKVNNEWLVEPRLLKEKDRIQLHHDMVLRVKRQGDNLLLEAEDASIRDFRYLLMKKRFTFYELDVKSSRVKVKGEKYELQDLVAQGDVTIGGRYQVEALLFKGKSIDKSQVAEPTLQIQKDELKK